MDDTFIKNYTMKKAHELGWEVVFNRKGKFIGYRGFSSIIYMRFLTDLVNGLEMPDYYVYIKEVNKDEFYNFIHSNIEGWLLE